ncbi:MAG TPA: NAD(P)/FAD-dependent oxidoreductase [Bryobacteraceae bacterium]|nr:NAD(P)/FAD-dependent oxidoreductase [Bryobacteraceae bacterium]
MSGITRRGLMQGAALAATQLRSPAQAQPERFDVVVAGAGHNSLISAAYLAKAGYRVLVLEGRPTIGGGCKTAEVCLPGFKEDLCSSVHSGFQSNPALRNNELNLRDYGLEYIDPDPIMHTQFTDGVSLTVWKDLDRTCAEYAKVSKKDAETFRRLVSEYTAYTKATAAARSGGEAKVPNARVWQRRMAMSGYDLVHELFVDDHIRSFHLAVGHFGGVPAGDPLTGAQAFSVIGQQLGGRPMPKGGSGMLTVALGRVLEANHAVILTNKPVARFLIEGSKCVGVECVDGSSYRAEKAVLSTIHIKHLVDMAPRELWGEEFLENVRLFQPEHAMFQFHYATTEPPKFPLAGGGTISPTETALLPNPERVLRLTYDNDRGEVNLDDPPLQIVCPTVADPSRAPAGYHTLKLEGTLPYQLKEGPQHWDVIKEHVAESLFNNLRRLSPNLTPDKILAKFLESPLDIERMNPAMWRGSAHHGANNPAQSGANRPVPGWSQYRMPIPGLYQTGACTPPGGSITGMPGRNAAAAMLKDFGSSIEEVVNKKA